MSMFVCDNCDTYENTALGSYWGREEGQRLCSACSPERGQRWHRKFPRTQVISGERGRMDMEAEPVKRVPWANRTHEPLKEPTP